MSLALKHSSWEGLLAFLACTCRGFGLKMIISFNFSWSQSCLSPTSLCSWTLCISCTSLMDLFLQKQKNPPVKQYRFHKINTQNKENDYLSGLPSVRIVIKTMIRTSISKCFSKSIPRTEINKVNSYNAYTDSESSKSVTFMLSLTRSFCPQVEENVCLFFLEQLCNNLSEEDKLVDKSFVGGRHSPLYTGSPSPGHQWVNFAVDVDVTFPMNQWEQASAMTPPPPQFTNSSFNTFAKGPHLSHCFEASTSFHPSLITIKTVNQTLTGS